MGGLTSLIKHIWRWLHSLFSNKKEKKIQEIIYQPKKPVQEQINQLNDPTVLEGLDKGQKKAVLSENSRILVLAGAGAGKTKVLLHRILHLIRNKDLKSYNILAVTFTNDATNEMIDRLILHFNKDYPKIIKNKSKEEIRSLRRKCIQEIPEIRYITISTIHSLCCKILREDGAKEFDNKFTILSDESDEPRKIIKLLLSQMSEEDPELLGKIKEYLITLLIENNIIKSLPNDYDIKTNPHFKEALEILVSTIIKLIDFAKSNSVSVTTINNNLKDEKHESILLFYEIFIPTYTAYQEYLTKNSKLDFNDMIHRAVSLFKKNPEVLRKYQKRFEHILVDEYQDVSASQVEFIKLLLTKDNNLFAVGDDWQSIYGFRGSEVEFIVNFEEEFKKSEVIQLPYNYRSGKNIVGASNEVIKKNPNQRIKVIHAFNPENDEKICQFDALSDDDGARFIIDTTKKLKSQGYGYSNILLLYRRGFHLRSYDDYFKKHGFKINIKTIHSSKGLESKIVFLIGLKQGHFPYVWEDPRIIQIIKEVKLSKKDEEERRVFYVAMTRAKEKLFLISEKHNESEYCKDIPGEFKKVELSESKLTEDMLSPTLTQTLKLVKEGKSAQEIAKVMQIEQSSAETYIAKLIFFGVLDIKDFVDEETYNLIKSKIPKGDTNPRLKPIKDSLPSTVTYGQIRYVREDLKRKDKI